MFVESVYVLCVEKKPKFCIGISLKNQSGCNSHTCNVYNINKLPSVLLQLFKTGTTSSELTAWKLNFLLDVIISKILCAQLFDVEPQLSSQTL